MVFLYSFFSSASNHQAAYHQSNTTLKSSVSGETRGEILIIFEQLSEKEYDDLNSRFSSLEGISVTGFCKRLKCYYVSYDKTVYRTPESVYEAVAEATKRYVPVLKTGTSEQVNKMCNQF